MGLKTSSSTWDFIFLPASLWSPWGSVPSWHLDGIWGLALTSGSAGWRGACGFGGLRDILCPSWAMGSGGPPPSFLDESCPAVSPSVPSSSGPCSGSSAPQLLGLPSVSARLTSDRSEAGGWEYPLFLFSALWDENPPFHQRRIPPPPHSPDQSYCLCQDTPGSMGSSPSGGSRALWWNFHGRNEQCHWISSWPLWRRMMRWRIQSLCWPQGLGWGSRRCRTWLLVLACGQCGWRRCWGWSWRWWHWGSWRVFWVASSGLQWKENDHF